MENEPEREKTNVPLNAKARLFVEGLRKTTGVPKVEALSRLLEFLAEFDHKAILAILNRDEEKKRELARLVLVQMAGLDRAELPRAAEELDVEQAAAAAQALIHRMLTAYRAEATMAKQERRGKAKG